MSKKIYLIIFYFCFFSNAHSEPRVYPDKKIGDYTIQVTELETSRNNGWITRIIDNANGVVCYVLNLDKEMNCVKLENNPSENKPKN